MSRVVALLTTDASLLRCELDRVRSAVRLTDAGGIAGLGSYEDQVVIQRRFGEGVPRGELWEAPNSEAALLMGGALGPGLSLEDDGQPFRFRQWLVSVLAPSEGQQRLRERLLAQLPEYLHRMARGSTLAEAIFIGVLAELRALGRIEDPQLDAKSLAGALARAVSAVSQVEPSTPVAIVATNGRVLGGVHNAWQPLFYRLLEGQPDCARCELPPNADEARPIVQDHRRRRSVVIASDPIEPTAWHAATPGVAFAVDRTLRLVTNGA